MENREYYFLIVLGEEQSLSQFPATVGYTTTEIETKPKTALKFYSVEGSSVYKTRGTRTEALRRTQQNLIKDTFPK